MAIDESVLPPLSEENPISERTNQVLEAIRMRTQAYNETLNKLLDANMGKFDCMSLAYGFMRAVRRENNLDKKTLINIYTLHLIWAIHQANITRVTSDYQIIKHI